MVIIKMVVVSREAYLLTLVPRVQQINYLVDVAGLSLQLIFTTMDRYCINRIADVSQGAEARQNCGHW